MLKKTNISGIYQIRSIIYPQRLYIGSAININQRWSSHKSNLRHNKHHSNKLQNHYNKYGENDLVYEILLGCDINDLEKIEQYFLDTYKPYFNLCSIAGNCTGFHHTEETKKKMSESTMGFKHSKETKKRMSEIAMGRPRSAETKLKMSIAKKGKKTWNKGLHGIYSNEYREKISKSRKGKGVTNGMRWKWSPETIEIVKRKRAETRKLKMLNLCQN